MHALTDLLGRPYALMLTPGNVSDMKGGPALLERAGGMRYLLGSKDDHTDRLRSLDRDIGATPTRIISPAATANTPSTTTSWLLTSCQAWRSNPQSPSGSERV